MSIKSYLARGLRFILKGVPEYHITANVATLSPNNLLNGRTALITGGTSGIGLEIAKAFLNANANIIITGRNQNKIQETCKKLKSIPHKSFIHGILMDNSQVDSFEDVFNQILQLEGIEQIDILVNNAGILGGNLKDVTETEYNNILDTNLKGTFFLSKLVGTYYKENQIKGNILNIASSSSLRPASSAYTISKWGIRGLTLGLAKSFASYGITVNGIAPGPTATKMLGKEKDTNIAFPSNPIHRYALPEEIANMAVVLVSDMGKTIIGDIVYMTGGAGLITFDDIEYNF